jgi:curved DNA-binding protein
MTGKGVKMKYKDYYKLMGLQRTATEAEIKTAHRKLARKYHPDLNKDAKAESQFKEIGEAYQVLKDPEKRAAYDRLGTGLKDGDEFRSPPDFNEGFEYAGAGSEQDTNDFFEGLFGDRHRRSQTHARARDWPGEDHHAKVSIPLKDAYTGAQRTFTLQMPSMDAQGRVTYKSRTLDVSIPKGILDGQRLRLAGQGAAGIGQGRAGDLYLEIAFEQQSRFRVEGRDVTLDLPVAPWEAALGAEVVVPTPDGSVTMTVPAGSAAGKRLRLKGRGIPGKPPGDLYVTLAIALPIADTDAKKAAYEALRQAFKFDPRAHFYG